MDKLRHLHLAFHVHQQLFVDGLKISGFYNWHQVFEKIQNDEPLKNPGYYGKFGYWHQEQDRLNDYDIIFIGISSPEIRGNLASLVREKLGVNSKTILVANVDYAVEMWPQAFNPTHLRQELSQCDYIFAAEMSMVSHIKALVPHKEIYHFPHPTDTDALKRLVQPIEKRNNRTLVTIHRYDNNWFDMYLATRNLKAPISNGKREAAITEAILLDPAIQLDCLPFFHFVTNGVVYPQFIDKLSKSKLVVDSYHKMHSYGRIPVECACLKIPIVSTNWVTSAINLWPETTIHAGDVWGQSNMAQRLIDDIDFYKKVTDYAYEQVESCSYAASYMNFMKMIGKV